LNATGDFSEDYADKIGSMLLIKYSGQDESGSPWAEVLGCATGLHDVYRKNQYNKVEKQVEEYVVHKENGIETKISDITYNKAQIYKIFEGSDQQDVLISFYADNVKVPAEGCKIFLRFKASKDQNKGHVYYAASATKENKPKQFKGNITRLNDSSAKTVFADDEKIESNFKPYISAAYELGYIKGVEKDGKLYFEPERPMTRAEAACLLSNMLDAATPTVTPSFSDSSEVPTWAQASVNAMTYMGVMNSVDNKISPLACVTRGDAAEILWNFMKVKESD
jgi:hypothetical protein